MQFKNAAVEARKITKINSEPRLVHFIAGVGELITLEDPCMSDQISCPTCGCKEHYNPLMDQRDTIDQKRMWICGNSVCLSAVEFLPSMATTIQVNHERAILWPSWCEINGVGDLFHDVRFEKINQSSGKIEYMRKFLLQPQGLILMLGDPGLGKTYACLGMCEYFTRKSQSCFFLTGKAMFDKWVDFSKRIQNDISLNYLFTCSLLIIDDFGTGEVNDKFMTFFMDLINQRSQWSNRGTVINTNLNDIKLSQICGEALFDRLKLAQVFEFTGESRRKFKPL